MDSFRTSVELNVNTEQLFADWLNEETHGAFTGGEAYIEAKVGGKITTYDEYTSGVITEIVPNKKIVQKWRTTEFEEDDEDSIVEIHFKSLPGNRTELSIAHLNLPIGEGKKYRKGWQDHYFDPMIEYYGQ